MKPVTLLLAFTGLVAAQLGDLPSCAQGCVSKYVTGDAIAGCNQLNAACICANSSFLDNIACCLADVCSQADQEKAVTYAKQICTANGVAVPDQVVCRSSSVSSTAAPTTSSASTAPTVAPLTTTSSQAGAPTGGPVAHGLLGAAALAAAALL